ncbi:unnamed protein product [Acanthoscelides obtectus]|uniref:Uncharacterized protein n=1 Tax=Acanthoscelides obtectus TaxID=200917 RepID=A0A9P0VT99_ACAOB|nr:unnamed protein product [Acanthoscelides obtectus]CAK1682728.1 SCAN domain-containing protein 3 [Acanthoscelides obtectus]
MKPSKLQDHLRRCHPDKTEKDLKYFQTLKDKFQKRPTLDRMFASTSQRNDDGLRASYNISLLIAKSGKPHTIGEKLILPAVEEVLKTVLHKPASDIIKRIPLSNNTVERRIDEMSSDIESFLCNYLQTTHFSIQLDESTLPDNAALLLAYSFYYESRNLRRTALRKNFDNDTKAFYIGICYCSTKFSGLRDRVKYGIGFKEMKRLYDSKGKFIFIFESPSYSQV